MSNQPEPLQALIPDAAAMFALAEDAFERLWLNPNSVLAAVTTALFINHLRDYAPEHEADAWEQCPYFRQIVEVANGGKHKTLKGRLADQSIVRGVEQVGGYGKGAFGVGPYGTPNIQLTSEPSPAVFETQSAVAMCREALKWWRPRVSHP